MGFTMFDNDLIDKKDLIHLSGNATKLLFIIFRYTNGFQRRGTKLTNCKLISETGLNNKTITKCLSELKRKGIIEVKTRQGQGRIINLCKYYTSEKRGNQTCVNITQVEDKVSNNKIDVATPKKEIESKETTCVKNTQPEKSLSENNKMEQDYSKDSVKDKSQLGESLHKTCVKNTQVGNQQPDSDNKLDVFENGIDKGLITCVKNTQVTPQKSFSEKHFENPKETRNKEYKERSRKKNKEKPSTFSKEKVDESSSTSSRSRSTRESSTTRPKESSSSSKDSSTKESSTTCTSNIDSTLGTSSHNIDSSTSSIEKVSQSKDNVNTSTEYLFEEASKVLKPSRNGKGKKSLEKKLSEDLRKIYFEEWKEVHGFYCSLTISEIGQFRYIARIEKDRDLFRRIVNFALKKDWYKYELIPSILLRKYSNLKAEYIEKRKTDPSLMTDEEWEEKCLRDYYPHKYNDEGVKENE